MAMPIIMVDTIKVVLQNLLVTTNEETKRVWGSDKYSSVLLIQKFLYEAEKKLNEDDKIKLWLQELETLVFELDNLLDDINYAILRRKVNIQKRKAEKVCLISIPDVAVIRRKMKADNVLDEIHSDILRLKVNIQKLKPEKFGFISISDLPVMRRNMHKKIRDIGDKLTDTVIEAMKCGLQLKIADPYPLISLASSSRTYSSVRDSIVVERKAVVGRKNEVAEIVDMLVNLPTEDDFSVISVVGMGGIGKTTLAQTVYNNDIIASHFGARVWVSAPKSYDGVTLLESILESLGEKHVEIENVSPQVIIMEKLKSRLGRERYLIVVDDLWNVDVGEWDKFMDSLSKISYFHGNGIVVTTRSESVASLVRTLPIYWLKILPDHDCMSIVKAEVFQGSKFNLAEFGAIGKTIVEKCRGLPLAAKVVGGLLRITPKDHWLSILDTPLSDQGSSNVMDMLKLSFDNLPSPSSRKCFAFCHIFPKDCRIERQMLIELWMAEGFLHANLGISKDSMENVGNTIFNHLIQNSLLIDAERDDYNNIISCKMHDLVHDLACFVSKSDVGKARCLSVNLPRGDRNAILKEHAKYVRTLFSHGNVAHSTIPDFKCLHILNLKHADMEELPVLIGKLIHLRYLDISFTKIKQLPNSIGKLFNLQTLRIVGSYKEKTLVKRLPDSSKFLTSLRHLYIPAIELPHGVGNFTCLQTLPYFKVGNGKGCRIGELKRLENLKGEMEIQCLERVRDTKEARGANLIGKANIVRLKFLWNERGEGEGETNDEEVLEGLQPHPNLKRLEIDGYSGKKFPMWTMVMEVQFKDYWIRLDNLIDVRLTDCHQCEELPMLGHLPLLKSLHLIGLMKVQYIGLSFYGIGNCNTEKANTISPSNSTDSEEMILFPALKCLELSKMPNLREWMEPEDELKAFPCLEYLKIRQCSKLMTAPRYFSFLKELKTCNVDDHLCFGNISRICNASEEREAGVSEKTLVSESIPPIGLIPSRPLFPSIVEREHAKMSTLGEMSSLAETGEEFTNAENGQELSNSERENVKMSTWVKMGSLAETAEEFTNPDNGQEISDSRKGKRRMSNYYIAPLAEVESATCSGTVIDREQIEEIFPADQNRVEASYHQTATSSNPADSIQDIVRVDTGSMHEVKTSSPSESINITLSITGELYEHVDLKVKISNTSLQEMWHLDWNSGNLDLELECNDYLILVRKKVMNQESSIPGDYFPSSVSLLCDKLTALLLPEHLICNGSRGLPTAEVWHQTCVMRLIEKDLDSLGKGPDLPNLAVLCLHRQSPLSDIPPSFFGRMPELHFLDLSGMKSRTLPSSLFSCTKLQVLLLRNCVCLDNLPSEIKNLKHIEVLDLLGTELYSLPYQVGHLKSLKALHMSFYGPDDEIEYFHLPSEFLCLGVLSKLQELQALRINVHPEDRRWTTMIDDIMLEVKELKQLSHIQFYFPKIENLQKFVQIIPSWSNNKLTAFKFVVGRDMKRVIPRVTDGVESKYDQLERSLRYVNGEDIPQVIKEVLARATSFCLDHHLRAHGLAQFGPSNFLQLKFCVLRECPNIEVIIDEEIWEAFPSLEYLGIHYLWNLHHIWYVHMPNSSFGALKYLTVCTCPELQFIFPIAMLSCLPNLEEFVVEDCEAVVNIVEGEMGDVNHDLMLPQLRKIQLRYLPQLVSLGNGLFLREEQINVHACPEFKLDEKPRRLFDSSCGCRICF